MGPQYTPKKGGNIKRKISSKEIFIFFSSVLVVAVVEKGRRI